ncbi:tautomerase family protein [Nocardia sp. NPDC020380]|uniref:tautomerase family protein n=1 Tax=Nocardia sp. NPDC020380 TaxID=3364309 RepID=UPI00379BAB14
MPLVRIDLMQGFTVDERKAIGDCVQLAMVETLNVPERDRFQIVTEHGAETFDFNRSYLDIERSVRFVMVQVTLSAGRTVEAKQAFYARLAELLAKQIGLRTEDLGIALTENQRHDWSFGHGEASYVVLPPEQWR